MARPINLFKILGIRISIDYTWFIVFILFAWSLAYGYYPAHVPGLAIPAYIVMGVISSLALFICVLIHELSHSYTSNRLGLDIKEITLFIFGGMAKLTREPDKAMDELKIAVAGPLASLVLAVVFYLLRSAVDTAYHFQPVTSVMGFLAYINLALLIFNIIPGFPLDGGRILRAVWWAKTGDLKKATRVASRIGKGFAIFLIVYGFFQIISGSFVPGVWALLIGVFLQQAAEGSYRQLIMKLSLEGVKVKDIMTRNVITIEGGISISDAIERYFFRYHFVSFPVVSNHGVVGLIALGNVRGIEKERWPATAVLDAMEKLSPERVLHPNDNVMHALSKMLSEEVGRFLVIDEGGNLAGILSRRDIMKSMEFKTELEG
ncbi:MAG: site-2 protease family protein [Deltaproteobacteria bacterium]|nr:site-2 protease family protein [Deltaproteobacteria bacterium]